MPVACIINLGTLRRYLIERPLKTVVRGHENPLVFGARIDDFHDVDLTASSPCAIG